MTGIVKIPSRKVLSFYTVVTMQILAHHFLPTLKNVDNVADSGTELSTFNPFVVGSTPAGPTKFKSTLYFGTKCFFHFCARHSASFTDVAICLGPAQFRGVRAESLQTEGSIAPMSRSDNDQPLGFMV
jgi:hypothetical protein